MNAPVPAIDLQAEASSPPRVSIIIPAFQAAATLDRALDSLVAQSFGDWEAVVVDDGSTDDTARVLARRAAGDPRILAFTQDNRGASAARNRGLRAARGEWIGFLDADDWFDPQFLETLIGVATRAPDAGTVYCDFALVDETGGILAEQRVPPLTDPFGTLARSCVLSVHCALTRAAIMRAAGPFDETLALNEDWDLWQRIARIGAPFRGVAEIRAYYYCRPRSLSRSPHRLAVDGMAVIDRVCRADPRLPMRDRRYAEGLPDEERLPLQFDWMLMCAANAIAVGEDSAPYIAMIADYSGIVVFAADAAAGTFVNGLAFGCCTDVAGLAGGWATLEPQVDRFWNALAAPLGQPRALDTLRALVRLRVLGPAAFDPPFAGAAVYACRVDVDRRLSSIDPQGRDAVIVQVVRGDEAQGLVMVPALGAISPAALGAAIVAAAPGWPARRRLLRANGLKNPAFWLRAAIGIGRSRGWGVKARIAAPRRIARAVPLRARVALARALAAGIGARLRFARDDGRYDAAVAAIADEEAARLAAEQPPPVATAADGAQAWREVAANSPAYWDQVFEQENPWAYDSAYEQAKYGYTLDLIGPDKPETALELACAEGHFTVRLAEKVGHLTATDISATAIARAAERCRALGNIDYAQLDFFERDPPGHYDLITCSEVLYECKSLTKLRRIAHRIADHLKPGGALVMAHVIEAAEERDRSGFDWDGVFGARTIGQVFGGIEGLALETVVETELYRIHRFRKTALPVRPERIERPIVAPPLPEYGAYVVWGGAKVTRREAARERAVALPILMYHRIAEPADGPAALAQYRTSPAAFEAQLRWLRQNGYHGITPADWLRAIERDEALPGRPVLLTFDDGYRDFATTAWPLLQHYGMAATVGIVSDKVGGSADWDGRYGPPAPLMDWDEIRKVAGEGAVIASHSASHAAFPALSGEAVLREAIRSRLAIGRALGAAPETIIYPYGAYDPLAGRAATLAGYRLGLGTTDTTATLLDDPMHMPRLTVNGLVDLDAFIADVRRIDGESGRPRAG